MMQMFVKGKPMMHKHQCMAERIGEPMTVKEMHDFAVESLALEYRKTGAHCLIRDKQAFNEADLELSSIGDIIINILVVFRLDGSKSLDDIDTNWMVEEYRRSGLIPRVTFAYIDSSKEMIPKCGGEYSFSFYSVSLLPDEYNESLYEQLTPVQLAGKYAEAWKRLDASIISPYLDKDFHYKSDWVYDELPSRYEYLNYFGPKLNTVKRTGSVISVKVGINNVTGDVGLLMNQGENHLILLLTTNDGRITSARMAEYMPEYESSENKQPSKQQIQHFVNVGLSYIEALNHLKEDSPQDVSQILDILDCIHPAPGFNFGIYIEEPAPDEPASHACDQSWFHCYQGEEEPIMRRPYQSTKWKDGESENMLYLRFTFEIFEHLIIEPSSMGAWQAYLLCISKTLLPFSGRLYYTKRKLILTNDPHQEYINDYRFREIPELGKLAKDVSPYVIMDGNIAIVSCCYWNDWQGLIREYVPVLFENGRVKIGDFREEVLFKYDIGIRY